MSRLRFSRLFRLCIAGLVLMLAGACSLLLPTPTPPPTFHSLDRAPGDARATAPAPSTASNAAPTLVVDPPHAAPGFDSRRITYVREPHKLEYFAHSEWVDTPARMLAPLIVAAIENSGTFRAVVSTPSAAAGDMSLDTEVVRLQQDFGSRPSRVRFTLRATLVDTATRRVLAWRELDAAVATATDDPHGGVVAANRAVQTVLQQLSSFCTEAAAAWQPAASSARKGAGLTVLGR